MKTIDNFDAPIPGTRYQPYLIEIYQQSQALPRLPWRLVLHGFGVVQEGNFVTMQAALNYAGTFTFYEPTQDQVTCGGLFSCD